MKRFALPMYLVVCVALTGLWKTAWSGPYMAYSLGEAINLARASVSAEGLKTLAGITRILGMVQTPNGDIILVGRVVEGQSGATLDDLSIALRARLVHDEWPTVSLDATADTVATGLHSVTWLAGIDACQFGADFLYADIVLKKLSMEAPSPVGLPSFRSVLEDGVAADLRRQGVTVASVDWRDKQDLESGLKPMLDSTVSSEAAYQARFWFTARNPRFVARDGVFSGYTQDPCRFER